MTNNAVHISKKILRIGAEVVLLIGVLVAAAWCGLLWRLSQGPLQLSFLVPAMEKSFGEIQPEFIFDIGNAELTWGGRTKPFIVEIEHLKVTRTDNSPVLTVQKVGVRLSKKNIIFGRIIPREIKVYEPHLRLIRQADGHLNLNVDAPSDDQGAEQLANSSDSRAMLVRNLLRQLHERQGLGIFDGLRQITISHAAVVFDDQFLGTQWQSSDANIIFARSQKGMTASVAAALNMSSQPAGYVQGQFSYDWDRKETQADISFAGLVPAQIAGGAERLKDLSEISMPLKGRVQGTFDEVFLPLDVRFILGADAGEFNMRGLYKEPLAVKSLYVSGHYNGLDVEGAIDELKIDLGGPKIEAKASVTTEGDKKIISASGLLTDMPLDDFGHYCPESLGTDVRGWMVGHLSKGIATRATIDMALAYDPASKQTDIRKIGGEIDYHGIKVDYFPPMMFVTDAAGKAVYDKDNFNISVTSAKLGDMKVGKSSVNMSKLSQQDETHHAWADITATVSGPLKTALKVIDEKPLGYPRMLGIDVAKAEGDADVTVNIQFPLHNELQLHEVKVKADATVNNVALDNMVAGLPISGGPMDVAVSNGSLKVKGKARVGSVPATFEWEKDFTDKAPFSARATASGPADAATLLHFGLPKELNVVGTVPVTVDYKLGYDSKAAIGIKADLTGSSFTVPYVDVQKQTGDKGDVSLNLMLQNERLTNISALSLQTKNMTAQGDVDFASDGGIKRAKLPQLIFGDTNIAVDAENTGSAGYRVAITGKQLDVSAFFKDTPDENSDEKAAIRQTPLSLDLSVEKLITGQDRGLSQVRISLLRNEWQRIDRLSLDGVAGARPVTVRYLPENGGHSLKVEAGNAGVALNAFGVVKSVRGGALSINARTPQKAGSSRDLAGTAILTDFALKDAPVIARLLNAMSLPGILSLLSGEGVSFKKARVDFTWTDRGQPQQKNNVRLIKMKNGKTSGSSLGLTFEGSIDNWKNVYDVNGTIIPVSDINKLLSVIPLVGNILTANGEGIIAATYTVTGPMSQPSVMVNPLAVLAPGILRKIFFEN